MLIDVTVRHPHAERYITQASTMNGHAAAVANDDKQRRYPPRGGRRCTTFAVETFGRIGAAAEDALSQLAVTARASAARRGLNCTGFETAARARLDAVLQRGVARLVLAARHGGMGRAARWRQGGNVDAIAAKNDSAVGQPDE